MERGSDKHGFRTDDALAAETRGLVTSGREPHAEEWAEAEPSGEDEPTVGLAPNGTPAVGVPEGMTPEAVEQRAELARYLPRHVFPAVRIQLLDALREAHAPEVLLDRLEALPAGREFNAFGEVWSALHGEVEAHRF